eukprot:GHVU01086699.1.p1 GENE.GHVU01086699.1~~GHVU01086699.1.p1  ORF type:complete len:186 (+),score=8.46 GHVU01086699.1:219-776(+)
MQQSLKMQSLQNSRRVGSQKTYPRSEGGHIRAADSSISFMHSKETRSFKSQAQMTTVSMNRLKRLRYHNSHPTAIHGIKHSRTCYYDPLSSRFTYVHGQFLDLSLVVLHYVMKCRLHVVLRNKIDGHTFSVRKEMARVANAGKVASEADTNTRRVEHRKRSEYLNLREYCLLPRALRITIPNPNP